MGEENHHGKKIKVFISRTSIIMNLPGGLAKHLKVLRTQERGISKSDLAMREQRTAMGEEKLNANPTCCRQRSDQNSSGSSTADPEDHFMNREKKTQ